MINVEEVPRKAVLRAIGDYYDTDHPELWLLSADERLALGQYMNWLALTDGTFIRERRDGT